MKHYQYHERRSNLPWLAMASGTLLLSTSLLAAPGGVATGLQLWLKADSLSLANGAAISTWGDSSGNPAITTQATPQVGGITYVTNTANFNPGLQFPGLVVYQSLRGVASSNLFDPASTSGATLISVSAATNSQLGDVSSTLFTYTNNSLGGVGITYSASTGRYYNDGSGSLGVCTNTIPNNTYALVTTTYTGGSITGGLIYLNGASQANSCSGVAPVYASHGFEIGGRTFDPNIQRVFKGIINEVMYYNGQLSATDRQRVESYLAVKYSLTKAGNYLAADGTTTFWDATANATYHHDVTVIGRDDANPLSQLKSKSVNFTAIVTLDNGAAFATDKSFLAIGDNAGTTTLDQPDVPSKLRMARVWKVAKTGTVGNVTVTTTGAAGETYLLIDTDGDCNFTTGTITKTALTSNSATVTFTDGQCFSFAKESVPAAPTNLTATVTTGATSINLGWTDNSNNETGFKIESPVGTLINTTAANEVSYSHTGLTCNTPYNYQVTATNAIGDSIAITATVTPVCYTLTLQTAGLGTGTVTGAGLYPVGQAITLTAMPTNGSTFAGWTPPASCITGLTLSANTTCTATFDKTNQSITFTPPTNATYGNAPLTLTATGGGSGNPITLASTTTTICTVSGTTLTIVSAGTCNVTANQAGNSNYNAAPPVNGSILINKANQTISFSPPTNVTYSPNGTVPLSSSSTSGLTVTLASTTPSVCTVSGTTLTMVNAGTCTVTADQAGNGNYSPAPQVSGNLSIGQADQVISFTPPATATYGNAPLTLTATGGGSGNPVTFVSTTPNVCTTSGTNGATLTIVNAGTCLVTADQAGNNNYQPAPQVSRPLTFNQATQTLIFTPLTAVTLGDPPQTLSGTATSGLPVTFASLTPSVCAVSGNQLIFTNVGICTVTANQSGDANYQAAPQVVQEMEIKLLSPRTVQITLAGTGQGSVTSNPLGFDCSSTISACTLTVDGTRWVYLTPTPATGSTFVGWSGDPACTENAPGKVFLLQDTACTATFDLKFYTLTVEQNVPGVTVKGDGINCQDTPQGFLNLEGCKNSSCTPPPDGLENPGCQATYPYGTTVKLEVTTPRKWEFLGWEGSCDTQGQITLTQDRVCRAKFGGDPNIPNVGDGNGDGVLDARQENVMSLPDKVAGNYITLVVNPECVIADGSTLLAENLDNYDPNHPAPQGLMYFEIRCSQTLVTMYFHGVTRVPRNVELLKYGPTTPGDENTVGWYKLPNVQFGVATVGGKPVATVTYTLVDGQLGDNTGVDGKIVDPAGITW